MSVQAVLPTAEEVEAIRAGDRETINRCYMANYEFIKSRACSYLLKKEGHFSEWDIEELAHEVYLSFPEVDFDCECYMTVSLYRIFFFFYYDGRNAYYKNYGYHQTIVSLDAPVSVSTRGGEREDGVILGELLPAPELEDREDTSEIVFRVFAKYLTKKQREVFYYRIFTGFTLKEIAQTLGVERGVIRSYMNRIWKVFIRNYAEILVRLWKRGLSASLYYLRKRIIPPRYQAVQESYKRQQERSRKRYCELRKNPAWREWKKAYMRAYDAKKKNKE